jgi:twitching motility protein PilT
VPVQIDGTNMVVAMAEPTNIAAVREIQAATGFTIHPALAVRRLILGAIESAKERRPSLEEEVLREAAEALPAPVDEKEIRVHDLLDRTIDEGASDLHLTAGTAPTVRVRGSLLRLEDYPILQPAEIRRLVYSILTQRQREKLEENLELDLAYTLPGKARFRVNVYFQRDAMGAAFRLIPVDIRSIEDLMLPPRVGDFARLQRGFVLVTGPTGHGKSTTLAGLIDVVNRERPDHIMTVEDPIEYLHHHKTAVVNQREVGTDTKSFASALKHVLRQDPDVILVGEMRDLETIQVALTAAETGHLVFATLHTQDAPQTIDRVIDVFPPHQQQQVRVQLAASIQGIVSQQLLPTKDGRGRVAACEILVATPAIRNLIREGKTHMIYSAMQAGGKYGMQTMDQALADLVKRQKISYELGLERCHNAEDFNKLCGRAF